MQRLKLLVAVPLLGACVSEREPTLSGLELYANHCAACHGAQGEGDGPVAAVMQVSVPNLRTLNQRNGGEFPAEAAAAYIDGRELPVSHGDRYMPIWGNVFSWPDRDSPDVERAAQLRIAAVVEFLEQIQY